MKLLGQYVNGNYNVSIFSDGTKIRENDLDNFTPSFPECADVKITNQCEMACKYCFPSGMKIMTPIGEKNIEEIKVGDEVISFNIETKKNEIKKVTKLFSRNYSGEMSLIDNNVNLSSTPNHKVFTINRGYIRADQLTDDDKLVYYINEN